MDLSAFADFSVLAQQAAETATENLGIVASLAKRFRGGGWGMYPITLCLGFLVWLLADRINVLFFKAATNKDEFVRGLKKYIFAGDLDKAISYVESTKQTPVSAMIRAGLVNVAKGESSVQFAMDEVALRENPKIEKRTGYLAMIGNAAMLCGLLGTVSGLITCFEAVAKDTVTNVTIRNGVVVDKATILSEGISEAMNCTAFGLLTAIPALVLFSLLMGRTQHMLDDINETSVGVMNLILANRDKLKLPQGRTATAEE